MSFPRRLVIASALAGILVSARAQNQPQKAIGEIFASDASVKGAVLLASNGMQVMSGSSVAAGQSAALLVLQRGGYVRICPRTSLAISSSRTGRDLMFGMSTGAVEADYKLEASADAILTPDFRILFAGPGMFHVAVAADARGNTCVRSLDHNSAAIIISELMGDGTYQVKPGDQVVFHNGKLSDAEHAVSVCGCANPTPLIRAAATPPAPVTAEPANPAPPSAASPIAPPPAATYLAGAPPAFPGPADQPLPPPLAHEVHVQVDAPFVFSARSEVQAAPLRQVARLSLSTTPEMALIPAPPKPMDLRPPAPPPPAAPQARREPPHKRGFFAKVGSFFASIFR